MKWNPTSANMHSIRIKENSDTYNKTRKRNSIIPFVSLSRCWSYQDTSPVLLTPWLSRSASLTSILRSPVDSDWLYGHTIGGRSFIASRFCHQLPIKQRCQLQAPKLSFLFKVGLRIVLQTAYRRPMPTLSEWKDNRTCWWLMQTENLSKRRSRHRMLQLHTW